MLNNIFLNVIKQEKIIFYITFFFVFVVALKHTETKRYIVLYNTLNDKFGYLEKELNILNSIQDSYAQ